MKKPPKPPKRIYVAISRTTGLIGTVQRVRAILDIYYKGTDADVFTYALVPPRAKRGRKSK